MASFNDLVKNSFGQKIQNTSSVEFDSLEPIKVEGSSRTNNPELLTNPNLLPFIKTKKDGSPSRQVDFSNPDIYEALLREGRELEILDDIEEKILSDKEESRGKATAIERGLASLAIIPQLTGMIYNSHISPVVTNLDLSGTKEGFRKNMNRLGIEATGVPSTLRFLKNLGDNTKSTLIDVTVKGKAPNQDTFDKYDLFKSIDRDIEEVIKQGEETGQINGIPYNHKMGDLYKNFKEADVPIADTLLKKVNQDWGMEVEDIGYLADFGVSIIEPAPSGKVAQKIAQKMGFTAGLNKVRFGSSVMDTVNREENRDLIKQILTKGNNGSPYKWNEIQSALKKISPDRAISVAQISLKGGDEVTGKIADQIIDLIDEKQNLLLSNDSQIIDLASRNVRGFDKLENLFTNSKGQVPDYNFIPISLTTTSSETKKFSQDLQTFNNRLDLINKNATIDDLADLINLDPVLNRARRIRTYPSQSVFNEKLNIFDTLYNNADSLSKKLLNKTREDIGLKSIVNNLVTKTSNFVNSSKFISKVGSAFNPGFGNETNMLRLLKKSISVRAASKQAEKEISTLMKRSVESINSLQDNKVLKQEALELLSKLPEDAKFKIGDISVLNEDNALALIIDSFSKIEKYIPEKSGVRNFHKSFKSATSIVNSWLRTYGISPNELEDYFPYKFRGAAKPQSNILGGSLLEKSDTLSNHLKNGVKLTTTPSIALSELIQESINTVKFFKPFQVIQNTRFNGLSQVLGNPKFLNRFNKFKSVGDISGVLLKDTLDIINQTKPFTKNEFSKLVPTLKASSLSKKIDVDYVKNVEGLPDLVIGIKKGEVLKVKELTQLKDILVSVTGTKASSDLVEGLLKIDRLVDKDLFGVMKEEMFAESSNAFSKFLKQLPSEYQDIFSLAYLVNPKISIGSEQGGTVQLRIREVMKDSSNVDFFRRNPDLVVKIMGHPDINVIPDIYKKLLNDITQDFQKVTGESLDDISETVEELLPDSQKKAYFTNISGGKVDDAKRSVKMIGNLISQALYGINRTYAKMLVATSPTLPFTNSFSNLIADTIHNGFMSPGTMKRRFKMTSATIAFTERQVDEMRKTISGLTQKNFSNTGDLIRKASEFMQGIRVTPNFDEISSLKPSEQRVVKLWMRSQTFKDVGNSARYGGDILEMTGLSNIHAKTLFETITDDPFGFMYSNVLSDRLFQLSTLERMLKEFGDENVALDKFDDFFKTVYDLSAFEQVISRRFFMFYTWARNNMVNTFSVINKPRAFATLSAINRTMLSHRDNEEFDEVYRNLPEDSWMRNSIWIHTPFGVQMGLRTPGEEAVNSVGTSLIPSVIAFNLASNGLRGGEILRNMMGSTNLAASSIYGVLTNQDVRTGRLIDPFKGNLREINVKADGYRRTKTLYGEIIDRTMPDGIKKMLEFQRQENDFTGKYDYYMNPTVNYVLDKMPVTILRKLTNFKKNDEGFKGSITDKDIPVELMDLVGFFTHINIVGMNELNTIDKYSQQDFNFVAKNVLERNNKIDIFENVVPDTRYRTSLGLSANMEDFNEEELVGILKDNGLTRKESLDIVKALQEDL